MLAQLKTFVVIKEAIKLAFGLVEYLEHQHLWVRLQAQNGQKQRPFFWNSSVYSCSEEWRLFHARNCQESEDLVQHCVLPLPRTAQTVSNQNRKRSGRPRCTTEQEDKYIRVSSLKNRCLTSPQLAASWNSTRKTPFSTVKRRLRDAGILGRVAKKNPNLRLANKKKRLTWAKEHSHWTEELSLEGQHPISLQLCLEGQHPGVASSLLTLRLCFAGTI